MLPMFMAITMITYDDTPSEGNHVSNNRDVITPIRNSSANVCRNKMRWIHSFICKNAINIISCELLMHIELIIGPKTLIFGKLETAEWIQFFNKFSVKYSIIKICIVINYVLRSLKTNWHL